MSESHRIDRLGHLGDGIAPGPVYAPGCLPGELVSGRPEGDRLTDIRILDPSPDRVRPPCRHARTCGGCTLQHASDSFLSGWKAEVVRTALAGQGLRAEIAEIVTSPPGSRRRATLHGRRTKSGTNVGFFAKSSDLLVDTPDCLLLEPGLIALLPALHDLTALGASRKSALDLAVTLTATGADVAVGGARAMDPGLYGALAALAARHDLARLVWNGEVVVSARPPELTLGPASVRPPPAAFLQATAAGQAALVAAVERIVAGAGRVADLFAGCGTFSLPLSAHSTVHAVDGQGEMLNAAYDGWRRASGLHPLTVESRDLFRRPLLRDEIDTYDAVVIDPPRAGAAAQMREIAAARVPVVAAVSCNPVTFARDARILADAGFTAGPITLVDQFRWSPHIELVAGFSRRA